MTKGLLLWLPSADTTSGLSAEGPLHQTCRYSNDVLNGACSANGWQLDMCTTEAPNHCWRWYVGSRWGGREMGHFREELEACWGGRGGYGGCWTHGSRSWAPSSLNKGRQKWLITFSFLWVRARRGASHFSWSDLQNSSSNWLLDWLAFCFVLF